MIHVNTLATPSTSNKCDGVAVPIPTLLVVELTFNVVVSIVMSPDTARLVNVPTEVTLACAAVANVPVRLVADTFVNPLTVAGSPIVTIPLDSPVSTSLAVPLKHIVPPNDIAVEFPSSSAIVIVELASLPLAIDPASCALVIVPTKLEVG